MERDRHGRSLKQQTAWTPGHNFSLAAAAGYCFSSSSWPAALSPPPSSSYTCGYCRREFRSAQALGGHMNVHRRDRARLRQCFPPPNPSNLVRTAAPCRRAAPPIPNLNFLPPEPAPAVYSFLSTTTAGTMKYASAAAVEVNLDLGIGGVCSHDGTDAAEDDGELDLELRLGCSCE